MCSTSSSGRLLAQQSLYSGGETVAGTRRAENQVLSGRARLADAEQDRPARRRQRLCRCRPGPQCAALVAGESRPAERYPAAPQERFRGRRADPHRRLPGDSRVAGAMADLARPRASSRRPWPSIERAVGRRRASSTPVEPSAELPATARRGAGRGHRTIRASSRRASISRRPRDQVRVDEAQLLPEVNLVGELSRRRQPSINVHPARRRLDRRRDRRPDLPAWCRIFARPPVEADRRPAALRPDRHRARRCGARSSPASRRCRPSARRSLPSTSRSRRPQAALEGTREEAIAGARTVLDVLNAEHELFIAQIRRERARRAGGRWRATGCAPRSVGLTLAGLGRRGPALRSAGPLSRGPRPLVRPRASIQGASEPGARNPTSRHRIATRRGRGGDNGSNRWPGKDAVTAWSYRAAAGRRCGACL